MGHKSLVIVPDLTYRVKYAGAKRCVPNFWQGSIPMPPRQPKIWDTPGAKRTRLDRQSGR